METIPTNHAEVDENGRKISQYCLGLPTILRQILKQFSSNELMGLSLVNKLWNFEARSVIRERGNFRANLLRGDNKVKPCEKLVAFASDLENMRVIPVCGIRFFMTHRANCRPSVSNASLLDPRYQVILDQLPWKHLSVQFYDYWDRCKGCPALLLVKRILEDYCNVLEELTLGFANEQFLRTIFQDRTFPRLKSLAIESSLDASADGFLTTTFVKALISCAPNLQELHVNCDIDLTVNILEGRSGVVLVPAFRFCPLFKPICQDLIGCIRSEIMEICIHKDEFDSELLNRFTPKVLELSRSTLKTFIMDLLFAVPLMCYGICFENVTELEIHMNCYSVKYLDPSILNLPAGLDFTRVFPKLTQVRILDNMNLDFSSNVINAFVEQGTVVLSRTLPDRATNIKLLDLERCSSMKDFTLLVLAQMFPAVTTVHTKGRHRGASFENLREHFLCLEKVIESECEMVINLRLTCLNWG